MRTKVVQPSWQTTRFLLLGALVLGGGCGGEDISVLEELGEDESALGPVQNDMGTGRDAGNFLGYATVPAVMSGTGQLPTYWDWADYYKITVPSGQTITISMTPPSTANFNLYLYRPNASRAASSTRATGLAESISFVADASGDWRVLVYKVSGVGTYGLTITLPGTPSLGDCGIEGITGPDTVSKDDSTTRVFATVKNFGDSAVTCRYDMSLLAGWGDEYYADGVSYEGNHLTPDAPGSSYTASMPAVAWGEDTWPGNYAIIACAFDNAAAVGHQLWVGPLSLSDMGENFPEDADSSNACDVWFYTVVE